jgi:methionyl-tRNA synthetase
MASIRTLKKDLNYLSYELLTEAFAYKHFHSDMEEKKFDEAIRNLVKIRNEILGKINHPEPFESPAEQKQHYRNIHEGMVRLVQVLDELDK